MPCPYRRNINSTDMIDPSSSTGVLGTLGVNAKLFIAQLVNFSIVLLVMWRWVYRPLVAMMDTRAKEITDGLKNAEEAKRKLADASDERDKMLRQTKAEAHAVIEEAKANVEVVREEKLALMKQDLEKLVDDANARIQNDRDATFDALKNDVAMLVTLATQKVAGKMDEKTQRGLIAEAIKEVHH